MFVSLFFFVEIPEFGTCIDSRNFPAGDGFKEFTRVSYRVFLFSYMLYVFWIKIYYGSCLFSLLSMPVFESEVS